MFCSQCGSAVGEGVRFCARCGAAVIAPGSNGGESTASTVLGPQAEKVPPRPWVRYWARLFDIYAFALVAGVVLAYFDAAFLEGANERLLGLFLVFVWVFVESLLLALFQTAPGKWLFKIRIAPASGGSIGLSQALSRSLMVWWRGFGAGVPLVTLFTLISAHGQLTRNGVTTWDRDGGYVVSHEKIGVPRALAIVGLFVGILAVSSA